MKPCISPFSTAYRTTRYRPEGELLSDIHFKLIRAVSKFDPGERLCVHVRVARDRERYLCTSVSNARQDSARYRRLTKVFLDRLITNAEIESGHIVTDLTHRIRRLALGPFPVRR